MLRPYTVPRALMTRGQHRNEQRRVYSDDEKPDTHTLVFHNPAKDVGKPADRGWYLADRLRDEFPGIMCQR